MGSFCPYCHIPLHSYSMWPSTCQNLSICLLLIKHFFSEVHLICYSASLQPQILFPCSPFIVDSSTYRVAKHENSVSSSFKSGPARVSLSGVNWAHRIRLSSVQKQSLNQRMETCERKPSRGGVRWWAGLLFGDLDREEGQGSGRARCTVLPPFQDHQLLCTWPAVILPEGYLRRLCTPWGDVQPSRFIPGTWACSPRCAASARATLWASETKHKGEGGGAENSG